MSNNDDAFSDAVFISADGLRATAPWKVQSFGMAGPLTERQMRQLAERFDLDNANLRLLSMGLGIALEPYSNLVGVSRAKAQAKAKAVLSAVQKKLDGVLSRLEAVISDLSELSVDEFDDLEGSHYDAMLKEMIAHLAGLRAEKSALVTYLESADILLKLDPPDRRHLKDCRRDEVLFFVFQAWVSAGRKITFTTDPLTSERRGRLIDFVQDVVACVTDPPTKLKPETIVSAIRSMDKSMRPLTEVMREVSGLIGRDN